MFFVGRLEGWAVFQSLVGSLQRRATITAIGSLEEDTDRVMFTETHQFDDGHSDTLHWTIRKLAKGQYSGLENRLQAKRRANSAVAPFAGPIRGMFFRTRNPRG